MYFVYSTFLSQKVLFIMINFKLQIKDGDVLCNNEKEREIT
ncbi:hypothetical protein SAMN04487909_15510 [Aneurinibacillus migulanus]|uniref:Uncharacterized protein n=1 Tax=Aneurinibacillus migulanus TaxID=47500 RepID=A0A1G9BUL1_ANEMI|nr:hypothetical protein SAMN04487909_15510 [Aneurinibacillus migulanus]